MVQLEQRKTFRTMSRRSDSSTGGVYMCGCFTCVDGSRSVEVLGVWWTVCWGRQVETLGT